MFKLCCLKQLQRLIQYSVMFINHATFSIIQYRLHYKEFMTWGVGVKGYFYHNTEKAAQSLQIYEKSFLHGTR